MLQRKIEEVRQLLPLTEDRVEQFEELVSDIVGIGGRDAARELLLLLDDSCDLGGVMQGVAITLQSFELRDLVQAFLDTLESTSKRAPQSLRDVLRWILSSDNGRTLLKDAVPAIDEGTASKLRELLERVGQFSTYAERSKEVLDKLR